MVGSTKRATPKETPSKSARNVSKAIKDETLSPVTPTRMTRTKASKTPSKRQSMTPSMTPSKSPAKTTPKNTRFTHRLPTKEQRKGNGRQSGRNLIIWSRKSTFSPPRRVVTNIIGPRMAEKLLLNMQYELLRRGGQIPWQEIAHRLHPGSSGASVQQHLNRVRAELIAEGHVVPPQANTKVAGAKRVDPAIRGFVRMFPDSDDFKTVRPVRYEEGIEDLRFNLPDVDYHSLDGNSPDVVYGLADHESKPAVEQLDADVDSDVDAEGDEDFEADVEDDGESAAEESESEENMLDSTASIHSPNSPSPKGRASKMGSASSGMRAAKTPSDPFASGSSRIKPERHYGGAMELDLFRRHKDEMPQMSQVRCLAKIPARV